MPEFIESDIVASVKPYTQMMEDLYCKCDAPTPGAMPVVLDSEIVISVKPHTQTPEYSHCKLDTPPPEAMAFTP
jgi:hypothetical protein